MTIPVMYNMWLIHFLNRYDFTLKVLHCKTLHYAMYPLPYHNAIHVSCYLCINIYPYSIYMYQFQYCRKWVILSNCTVHWFRAIIISTPLSFSVWPRSMKKRTDNVLVLNERKNIFLHIPLTLGKQRICITSRKILFSQWDFFISLIIFNTRKYTLYSILFWLCIMYGRSAMKFLYEIH